MFQMTAFGPNLVQIGCWHGAEQPPDPLVSTLDVEKPPAWFRTATLEQLHTPWPGLSTPVLVIQGSPVKKYNLKLLVLNFWMGQHIRVQNRIANSPDTKSMGAHGLYRQGKNLGFSVNLVSKINKKYKNSRKISIFEIGSQFCKNLDLEIGKNSSSKTGQLYDKFFILV